MSVTHPDGGEHRSAPQNAPTFWGVNLSWATIWNMRLSFTTWFRTNLQASALSSLISWYLVSHDIIVLLKKIKFKNLFFVFILIFMYICEYYCWMFIKCLKLNFPIFCRHILSSWFVFFYCGTMWKYLYFLFHVLSGASDQRDLLVSQLE